MGLRAAIEAHLEHIVFVVAAHEVILEVEPPIGRAHLGSDPIVGHRQQRCADPRARASCAVTSVRRAPSASPFVRTMCVAKSRSPSRNHVSSPYLREHLSADQVSSRTPQPVSSLAKPRQRVHDRVKVGRDVQAMKLEIVAGVDDDAQPDRIAQLGKAVGHARTAETAGEHDDIRGH